MQVLDGDRGLRSEMLDQLGVERLELFRVARRDLQDADEAVPRDQRRAQHRRFANVLGLAGVAAVVVEQRRQPAGRLIVPLPPAVAVAIEAVDLFRLQQRRGVVGDRNPQSDPLALGLGPGDLFRHHAQRRFVLLADEQRRRMIVEGQRSDAVQDLIEEILGMDLLHDLPVDPIAHAKEPIAVDPMNGG